MRASISSKNNTVYKVDREELLTKNGTLPEQEEEFQLCEALRIASQAAVSNMFSQNSRFLDAFLECRISHHKKLLIEPGGYF